MGQKINPISLRLPYTNRNFDSSWYSHYYYSELISGDLKIQSYINSILKQLDYPEARLYIQSFQKKTKIFVFFCSPSKTRKIRLKLLNYKQYSSLNKKKKRGKIGTTVSTQNTKIWEHNIKKIYLCYILFQLFFWNTSSPLLNESPPARQKMYNFVVQGFLNNKISEALIRKKINKISALYSSPLTKVGTTSLLEQNGIFSPLVGLRSNCSSATQGSVQQSCTAVPYPSYRSHIEKILCQKLEKDCQIFPIKISNDYRSALFLAEEIVYYMERRVPFRKIKNRILKEVDRLRQIKGVRITCSGRVGGRSKKAQRAKTECVKYGQTSLHVFSSYIDFASKVALTPFGSVGIKVWICFQ